MWGDRKAIEEFGGFVSADAESDTEVWLRRLLVFLSSMILWLVLDQVILSLWGLGYVIGDTVYVRFLRSHRTRATQQKVYVAAVLSLVVGCWVGAMAIYLSCIDQGRFFFLGACVVVGQGLHCLSSHPRLGIALYTDLAVVCTTTFGVAYSVAKFAISSNLSIAIWVSSLAVLAYFIHSVHRTVSDREALNRRVTAELQDQKMKALGQFTSGVAHDFNNMLTVISGNIELAKLENLPPEVNALLNDAETASGNAAGLVRQLLAYSRKSTLQTDIWEVNDVITRVASVADRLLPETIQFRHLPTQNATYLRADGPMLETALLNLILNARDALEDTPGMIILHAIRPSANGMLTISVTDDGPGMPHDILERATDPFFTTKAVGKGSGLGLSMVAGFCEQSGGRLELENLSPRGLEARVILPLAEAPSEDTAPETAPPPAGSVPVK